MDFISNLPENIKEDILTCLSIKEAARTSLLSSAWKYTWTSIPELKFEFPIFTTTNKMEKMVDAILLQYNGPFVKFDLKNRDHCICALDTWISRTSLRNRIKELKLDFDFNRPEYTIHSSLFSCDKLTSLFLKSCTLKLPVGFKGFKFLRVLHFEDVTISDDCIKKLVSSCPVLEDLKLLNNTRHGILDIQAPNLKFLDICIYNDGFYLQSPNLLALTVNLHSQSEYNNIKPEQFLRGSNLERLHLGRHIMKSMANLHDIGMFPVIFHNLKNLSITFEDVEEATFVLTLLKSTPNLEVLDIKILDIHYLQLVGINEWKKFALERLRYVNIYFRCEIEVLILFAKFVSDSAPELLELEIETDMNSMPWRDIDAVVEQLLEFPVPALHFGQEGNRLRPHQSSSPHIFTCSFISFNRNVKVDENIKKI